MPTTQVNFSQKVSQLLEEIDNAKDISRQLEIALQVVVCLSRISTQHSRKLIEKQDQEIQVELHKIENSFNSKSKLACSLVTGIIMTTGGVLSASSVVPHFLNYPTAQATELAKRITSIGSGISGVGQGSSAFERIVDNTVQGKRTVGSQLLDLFKQKRSDSKESIQRSTRQSQDGLQSLKQSSQSAHQAVQQILK
ncbi:MAG: hypothetical protein WDZ27_06080 [Waddliaceae bacterium]